MNELKESFRRKLNLHETTMANIVDRVDEFSTYFDNINKCMDWTVDSRHTKLMAQLSGINSKIEDNANTSPEMALKPKWAEELKNDISSAVKKTSTEYIRNELRLFFDNFDVPNTQNVVQSTSIVNEKSLFIWT